MPQVKDKFQRITDEQYKFLVENFVFEGREEGWEYYRNDMSDPIYYLSKNKEEKYILGIAIRKTGNTNISIAIQHTAYNNEDIKKRTREQEPRQLLERIIKHYPHRDIYEREMKLKQKDKLDKELKRKDEGQVKPNRIKI